MSNYWEAAMNVADWLLVFAISVAIGILQWKRYKD